ncbi:MAG: CotH kinase family protein [Cyclobacteriaceae bacterium]
MRRINSYEISKGLLVLVLASLMTISCQEEMTGEFEDANFSAPDWTEATHGNGADPNYEVVFPMQQINTLELVMTKENWSSIQSNLTSLFGFGFGAGGQQTPGVFPAAEPDYVPVSMKFNGKEWYKVGFRLKGNSTLRNSWRNGIYKLPFRLNIDRYEDDYPQIQNQRFYGFKELSMSPGANDNSLIREKAGSDIFRMAGILCSQTAFYKVYLDFGDGLKYCGVYTMVEVVDDTMIKDQFKSKSGNIYKPESTFQNFILAQFEKKNKETENDYSDVQATITGLNSGLRLTDPAQWRTNLEQVFDADQFIKWLAINTTMLNWDTYGRIAHNYYLYNNPGKGLTWIPWDNNEAMMNRGNTTPPISLSTVTSGWPLIRYLMDDPVYNAKYKVYMQEFVDTVFTSEKMDALFTQYHEMISPYVIGPEAKEEVKYTHLTNTAAFTNELQVLKLHVITQNQAAFNYLK